jgi:hypothetical protein
MRRGDEDALFLVRSRAFESRRPIVVLARTPSSATFGMMSAAAFEKPDRIIFAASISSLVSEALEAGAAAMVAAGAGSLGSSAAGALPGSSAVGGSACEVNAAGAGASMPGVAHRFGVGAHIVVAQGDDELRNPRRPIDFDVDPVDVRGPLAAVVDVFELELAADPQELEIGADQQLGIGRPAHARLHRGTEAVDVQAYPRPGVGFRAGVLRLLPGLVPVHAAHLPERSRAGAVEVREPNPELAAPLALPPPNDVGFRRNLLRSAAEPAEKRLPDLRQVGGPQMHAGGRDIDSLSLERAVRIDLASELDNRFEWNALGFGVAAIFLKAHRFLQPVWMDPPYGRNAELAKFWHFGARGC